MRAHRRAWFGIGVGLMVAGCEFMTSSEGGPPIADRGHPGAPTGVSSEPGTSTVGDGTEGPATGTPTTSQPGTGAGQMTAGAWDDNRNFEWFVDYLESTRLEGLLELTDAERLEAHERFGGARSARDRLDIALVLDTTGSMGDEMRYLQSELDTIAAAISATHPAADPRWALVVYRDVGDDYVARATDFTDDLAEFRRSLAAESANGGGDYPEAPEAALEAMNGLSWRDGARVARLAFWVADAPHHAERRTRLRDAVRAAAEGDVHVYPVAASGTDALAEHAMRSTAQLTGGRYVFLTDDSGIGGEHAEPTLPCYFVTHLDDAIVRMVDVELSGRYREPDADEILRTGGDPEGGVCTLEDDTVLQVF